MALMLDGIGRLIAQYLEKPATGYKPFTPSDPDALRAAFEKYGPKPSQAQDRVSA